MAALRAAHADDGDAVYLAWELGELAIFQPARVLAARTYGVTTLTKRHVSVVGEEVRFCFRAKNRKLVRRTIRNATLAGGVAELLALPGGGRLLRCQGDGELTALTAPQLNVYLAENLGNGFTAKDFRTWGGTLLAASELARHGPSKDAREAKWTLAAVMSAVGKELCNTPAVARDSYVSPVVVDAYLEGRTLDDFRDAGRNGVRGLTADERALVRLLRASRPLTTGLVGRCPGHEGDMRTTMHRPRRRPTLREPGPPVPIPPDPAEPAPPFPEPLPEPDPRPDPESDRASELLKLAELPRSVVERGAPAMGASVVGGIVRLSRPLPAQAERWRRRR